MKHALLALLAGLLLGQTCAAATARATGSTTRTREAKQKYTGLTLRQTLAMGLKARRPVEFRYVDRIASLVRTGALSESMVKSTFIWARKQPGRQLQKFDIALRERAKKKGIRYTAPSTL
jgi:hypothetical protein